MRAAGSGSSAVTSQAAGVLVFAPGGDSHAPVIEYELRHRGVETIRFDYCSAVDSVLRFEPGVAEIDGVRVERSWTIWWRRSGRVPDASGLCAAEQALRREETEALVLGGLASTGARWVDEPHFVDRAEHTLLQLAAAAAAGARVPSTVATNSPDVARRLMEFGPVVAKSTSSGVGLAPYADLVTAGMVDLLPMAPTLLQEHLTAAADLRVVAVGDRVFVWRRARTSTDPVDWRAADPSGSNFRPVHYRPLEQLVPVVNKRLGLTFSVQDWVEVDGEPWFLEVNPAGQWLFLDGSAQIVAPALAQHLAGRRPDAAN